MQKRKMASETTACGICDSKHRTKPSSAWCFECNEGLCEECKEHHTLNKASKYHGIIPVNEFQKLPLSVLQNAKSCKLHGERYQVYCHKHECSCCTKCLIGDHRNCQDLTDINDVVCKIKSSNMVLEIENSLQELSKNLKMIQKNRSGNLSSFTLYRQNIEKKIQISRHTINKHLDCLESELLKELTKIENEESKKISQILASVERKEKEIDELQTSFSIIKQHASDLHTFLVSKQIEQELIDTESIIHSMQDNNELSDVIISLQSDEIVKGVNRNISTIGELVVQTSPCDMLLVRQKSKQAQANVAADIRRRPAHQYETVELENDSCFTVTVKPGGRCLEIWIKWAIQTADYTKWFYIRRH
ncbi:unnamed protein product [Mytilus edulis]|uniref:B box-type domain-containing protein n=1 Tax=Mytilus edulis TaxID=6550 RepID=A0A8S3QF36_MYTED|nr:unnamed protein product [Mytilus edulis]